MSRVLVLNASYEPLNICNWRRAVVLVLKGKADGLEFNGRLVYGDLRQPTVIRLKHFVRVPYRDVALTRRNILHRDSYACQYCGRFRHELTVDHVMPRSRGGKTVWNNVVAACHTCNRRKGSMTPEEAAMPLARPPRRPTWRDLINDSSLAGAGADWLPYLSEAG